MFDFGIKDLFKLAILLVPFIVPSMALADAYKLLFRVCGENAIIWSVCVYLWKQMGLQIIVYFIGLTLIDPHIDEAAQVDGAGYSRANAENVLGSLGYKFDYTDNLSGGKRVFSLFMLLLITCMLSFIVRHSDTYQKIFSQNKHQYMGTVGKLMICSIWLIAFRYLIGFAEFFEALRVFLNDDLLLLLKEQLLAWHLQVSLGIWSYTQKVILFVLINLIFLNSCRRQILIQ